MRQERGWLSESPDAPATPHEAAAAVMGVLAELREIRRQHASERAADASRRAAENRFRTSSMLALGTSVIAAPRPAMGCP